MMSRLLAKARRGPSTYDSDSARAQRAAQDFLIESLLDRDEVFRIAQAARLELASDHISQRIAKLMKEGK